MTVRCELPLISPKSIDGLNARIEQLQVELAET